MTTLADAVVQLANYTAGALIRPGEVISAPCSRLAARNSPWVRLQAARIVSAASFLWRLLRLSFPSSRIGAQSGFPNLIECAEVWPGTTQWNSRPAKLLEPKAFMPKRPKCAISCRHSKSGLREPVTCLDSGSMTCSDHSKSQDVEVIRIPWVHAGARRRPVKPILPHEPCYNIL